jgi:PEP-CTERM motif
LSIYLQALRCTSLTRLLLLFACSSLALADSIIQTSPSIIPTTGETLVAQSSSSGPPAVTGVPACFYGTSICLESAVMHDFQIISSQTVGSDEWDTFGTTLDGTISTSGGAAAPITFAGQGFIIVPGKSSLTETGTFTTELMGLQLFDQANLGDPTQIWAYPPVPSTGTTTITDLGNGTFSVDSVLNIYLAVTYNGGTTLYPAANGLGQAQSVAFFLEEAAPEPSTFVLLGLSLCAVPLLQRYRRN